MAKERDAAQKAVQEEQNLLTLSTDHILAKIFE